MRHFSHLAILVCGLLSLTTGRAENELPATNHTVTQPVYYDASSGTLPTEQGFRLIDSSLDNAPPRVDKGVLVQGATSMSGYQYWSASHIPLDFRPEGSGLNAEWIIRVEKSNYDRSVQYTGWTAAFYDRHGHGFFVFLAENHLVLHNAHSDPDPSVVEFKTTDALHHYRFVVDDDRGMIFVDGDTTPLLTKPVGEANSPKSNFNRVRFGDWTKLAGSKTQLRAFAYSSNASMKSPFHPATLTKRLQQGLQLHYAFDVQRADNVEIDESDRGNNAKIHGVRWTKDGAVGGAIEFDGKDDHLELGTNSPLRQSSVVTYSFWVRMHGDKPGGQVLGLGAKGGCGLGHIVVAYNWLQFVWTPTLPERDTSALYKGPAIALDKWHHIVVSLDYPNRSVKFFVDAVPIEHIDVADSIDNKPPTDWTPSDVYSIGQPDTVGAVVVNDEWRRFQGTLDELRVYDRMLSSAEIAALFRQRHKNVKQPRDSIPDNLFRGSMRNPLFGCS